MVSKIALVLALLVLWTPAASAEKRIVILDFKGPKSSAFRREVVRLAKQHAKLVPSSRYDRAADGVRGYRQNARGVAEVAERVDIDGVVVGTVRRRRGRYELKIRLREGVTGEFIGRELTATLRRPRFTNKVRNRLKRQLRSAIRELPDLSDLKDTGGGGFEDDERDSRRRRDDDERDSRRRRDDDERDSRRGRDDDEDFEDEDDGDFGDEEDFEDDEDEDGEKKLSDREDDGDSTTVSKSVLLDRKRRGRGLELSAGLSFSNRNLSFTATQNLMDTPQGYAGRIVPGFALYSSVYPLAFDQKRGGLLRNLGLNFFVDKILKIESKLEGDDDTVLATSQTKWGIGPIYRHNFGSKPTSPTARAHLRYSRSAFVIDKSGVPPGTRVDIPNVTYAYLEPGVALRWPFTTQIAAEGEVNIYQVMSTGDMQLADQYGGGTVRGFDFGAWGEYLVSTPLSLRLGVRFQRFSYTFDGSGALTHRDGNTGEDPDVEAATDQYMSLYTMVGYAF